MKQIKIPIEVSARHIHIKQENLEKLFGKGHKLKQFKPLSQYSDFASTDIVTIENNGRKISNVRIIGPTRNKEVLEISLTDAFYLKIKDMQIKTYADKSSPKITIIGTKGKVKIPVIIKQRHIHISDKEAERLRLNNNDIIKIKISGKRALIFDNVIVRTNPKYKLSVHLDTDEGNSAGIVKKSYGLLIR